jgi:hypothetical protein
MRMSTLGRRLMMGRASYMGYMPMGITALDSMPRNMLRLRMPLMRLLWFPSRFMLRRMMLGFLRRY